MPRKNLVLNQEQITKLDQEHRRTGASLSEITRRAIDSYLADNRTKLKSGPKLSNR